MVEVVIPGGRLVMEGGKPDELGIGGFPGTLDELGTTDEPGVEPEMGTEE